MIYIDKYKKYKNKYINLKGGHIDNTNFKEINNIVQKINKDRFNTQPIMLRGINYLQIIDLLYNDRYLMDILSFNNFCLYDEDNKDIYIFNNLGDQINSSGIIKTLKTTASESTNRIIFKTTLKENKIKLESIRKELKCFNVNLSGISREIERLNIELHKKCKNLNLKLDNYYNLDGEITLYNEIYKDNLVLCLYYNENCISSIILKYKDENTIEIDSITDDAYQGNKYNTLLRAIVIMLLSHIKCNSKQITKLYSTAANPISAWLLISNFDTTYSSKQIIIDDCVTQYTKEKLKDYIFSVYKQLPEGRVEIMIEVELSSSNLKKATDLFIKLTDGGTNNIICPK